MPTGIVLTFKVPSFRAGLFFNILGGPKVDLHCVSVSILSLTFDNTATVLIYLVLCENNSPCPALTKSANVGITRNITLS